MAIALVGTPQTGTAPNGNDVTLTFDGSPAEGDVVVVFGGHGVATGTVTDPGTGYTQIAIHSGGGRPVWGAWYKVMGATPDADVLCSGGGNSADAVAYISYMFSGVDATVLDQITTTTGPTLSTNPNCPSITTQTDDAWVLALAGGSTLDASVGTLAGYSNNVQQTGPNESQDITTAGATLLVATAGATDPPAWGSWANTWWYAATVALKPAAGGGDLLIAQESDKFRFVNSRIFGRVN